MTTLPEIERAIGQLSIEELQKFRRWFAEFDSAAWDRQIEVDIKAGKLDHLADEALAENDAGRTRDL